MRRSFTRSERVLIFKLAGGRCQECGDDLLPGWHCDHVVPFFAGGPTDLSNVQALCQACNLRKGKSMTDQFKPRKFQEELWQAASVNHDRGSRLTVGLAAPGWGKENAAIYTANMFARNFGARLAIIFTPRVNLARSYETNYEGPYRGPSGGRRRDRSRALREQFDPIRLEHLEHRPNAEPLVPSEWNWPVGIVSCYASLVSDMARGDKSLYRALAREYRGKFVLIADEAQFCGIDLESGEGGTQSATFFDELHSEAMHTVLLAGYDRRADNLPLVLCDDKYADPANGETRGKLLPDAQGTYGEGQELGYLRPFYVDYLDDDVVQLNFTTEELESYKLSENSTYLNQVLDKEPVWRALVDKVAERVRERKGVWSGYRGIICCKSMDQARQVMSYLSSQKFSGLRPLLAISQDGRQAHENMDAFRADDAPYDILVTVRMAYIGYDCRNITVVGILTHWRHIGHLFQQAGRGMRMLPNRPSDEQWCMLVAPADNGMRKFIEWLKFEQMKGLRKGPESTPVLGPPKAVIRAATPAEVTSESADESITDPEEYAEIEELRRRFSIAEPATKLKKLRDMWKYGFYSEEHNPPEQGDPTMPTEGGPSLTAKDIMREAASEVSRLMKDALSVCGVQPADGTDEYRQAVNWFYTRVANASCWAPEANTPEKSEQRLNAARNVHDECVKRGQVFW
jgi:hypothetical protein